MNISGDGFTVRPVGHDDLAPLLDLYRQCEDFLMNISGDGFTVRPVGHDDLAPLLDLYRQCEDFLALCTQPYASPEMVAADLRLSAEQGGAYGGIFDHQNALLGVLDVIPNGWGGEMGEAYIELLMIGAPYRRQGLGRRVVAALEDQLRADGRIQAVQAGVAANNQAGIAFWTRMGYDVVSGPEPAPDGTVCYGLRKPLEGASG